MVALAALLSLGAVDPAGRLADAEDEARARALFDQVRCVVCANESIAESRADIAGDLRGLIREEVAAGRTDAEIRAGLVDRYGDYVLLKPPVSPRTLALWGLPFVLLAGAGLWLWSRRARPELQAEPPLSAEEQARLDALMRRDEA